MSRAYSLISDDRTREITRFEAPDDRGAIERARELYIELDLRSVLLYGPEGRVASIHGEIDQAIQVLP